ncbi:MAG TPA: prepilin-type N-terminal cleavage/methylation domain-containing protein [Solirubrobacteraceae bacterium]|jgi:type II secretory pathway pseudopilin PulG|nr:prepilin-type N-terminal cleavage/methylation domain-containing protein [Solirubrobacteraceae bacterium]
MSRLSTSPRAEHGFTLIELLVAMLCAIVVIGGLLAILEFSLRQETHISDRVQADRIGRTALTHILDQLRSSCTGFQTSPIQAPPTTPESPLSSSGPLNMWFVTGYGNATSGEATISAVTLHDINWTSTGTSDSGLSLGTLRDYSFTGSGTPPNWTFPALKTSSATTTVLAKNVIPPLVAGVPTIFSYERYDNNYKNATDGELVAIAASELPLTTARAEEVAKVSISYTQAAESGQTGASRGGGRTTNLAGSVVLRFDPTETGKEVENEPCA